MDMSDLLSISISFVALIVSGFAVWYSHRQYELNRAELGNPSWYWTGANGSYVLRNGKSWEVYDVDLTVTVAGGDGTEPVFGVEIMPQHFNAILGTSSVRVSQETMVSFSGDELTVSWSRRPGGPREYWKCPLEN